MRREQGRIPVGNHLSAGQHPAMISVAVFHGQTDISVKSGYVWSEPV